MAKRSRSSKPAAAERAGAAESSRPGTAAPPGRQLVFLLSDSTGNLACHMVTAFLTQFPPGALIVRRFNFLRTQGQLADALAACEPARAIVFHAFVSPAFKRSVADHCARSGIPACDLTGHFVSFLSQACGLSPSNDLRALHEVDTAYERRVQALEFTLEHDDGLGLDSIGDADIVLAGVSRTSKTPTSIYLAQQGFRVANVALAIAVEPPKELLALGPDKVVGLVIDPQRLSQIRTRRNTEWKMGDTSYNDIDQVEEEVRWSRRLFGRHGWPVVDVTNQAIEESAARIVAMLKLG